MITLMPRESHANQNNPTRPIPSNLMRASGAAGHDNQRPRWRYFRAEGGPAARVGSSADGAVSPTKWTDSLPATAFGVITQVPPQEARATFPAVFESAMYVNPLPIAPRIQKLAFTGAYTSVPKTLPAVCATALPSSPRAAIGIPSSATTRPIVSMPFMASSLPYDPVPSSVWLSGWVSTATTFALHAVRTVRVRRSRCRRPEAVVRHSEHTVTAQALPAR